MNNETVNNNSRSMTNEKRIDNCCLADMVIDNITIYLDKAEVTRSVKYEIAEGQVLECVFEQLPSSIDKDSIRVEIQNNSVSILDVTYMSKSINENSEQNERLKKIRELLKTEQQNLESHEAKKSRFTKQKYVLDSFANTLIESNENSVNNNGITELNNPNEALREKKLQSQVNVYDPKHLETLTNFFQLYNDSGQKFDDSLLEIEQLIQQTRNCIAALENEEREIKLRQDEQLYRELFVSMEGRINGEFELNISYVVKNCSWRPAYDVRVSNNNGCKQIYYYGLVKQSSGEDWYQPSKFTLSTAEPGVGGTVPEIGIQRVQFKNLNEVIPETPSPPPISPLLSTPSIKKAPSKFSSFRKSKAQSMSIMESFLSESGPPEFNFPNKETKKETEENLINENQNNNSFNFSSVSFDVTRPPTLITCDNTECRVMIAVINLDPHYQHVTVPRLSQFAYLRTVSTNTSSYTLLAGPANIYIDSNFIGKTHLKTTSPCEEFNCNLGADRGIKITYLPMIKYKENRGKSICVTFKQEIQVINNHERPIKIIVLDQIPSSMDEKIKITLLEPIIKHPEKYDKTKHIRMSSNRIIEWECEIGSKNKKEMIMKFTVEHPIGRDVEILQIT